MHYFKNDELLKDSILPQFQLSIKPTKKLYFENFQKTPNFGRTVHTLDYALNLKLKIFEAYSLRSIGIYEKNEGKNDFWLILKGVLEKKYATSLGLNVT